MRLILTQVNGAYGLRDKENGFVGIEIVGTLFGSTGVFVSIRAFGAFGAFVSVSVSAQPGVAVGGVADQLGCVTTAGC